MSGLAMPGPIAFAIRHWPAGSPGGKGGEFMPAKAGGPAATGVGSATDRDSYKPERDWAGKVKADPDYAYHATNDDGLEGIALSGKLNVFRPSHGTPDQDAWPDGKTERRAYLIGDPDHATKFAPAEGRPVLLRIKREGAGLKRESTGDLYVTKPLSAKGLEYLSAGGWRPVKEHTRQWEGAFAVSFGVSLNRPQIDGPGTPYLGRGHPLSGVPGSSWEAGKGSSGGSGNG